MTLLRDKAENISLSSQQTSEDAAVVQRIAEEVTKVGVSIEVGVPLYDGCGSVM